MAIRATAFTLRLRLHYKAAPVAGVRAAYVMKLLLWLVAFTPFAAFGTEQFREVLFVDGHPFEFREFPLEQFISSEKLIAVYKPILCSAAWRGYRGQWVLYGNKLYLQQLDLTPCNESESPADLKKLFPESENGVGASWVTMDLVVPIGEREYIWGEERSPIIEFQAVVYKFEKGVLRARIIERIKE